MATKIYQLPYDVKEDKDISDWLDKLGKKRKAEVVRHAIRTYMKLTNNSTVVEPIVFGQQLQQKERQQEIVDTTPKKQAGALFVKKK